MLLWQKPLLTSCKSSTTRKASPGKKRPAGMRSLHWKMQIKGAWGIPPTSILQRKKCFCIDENIACRYNVIDETKIVSSKTVIWLCRFPKNSNIEVLTGAKRFIFLTPYSLASFCERFQVSDLIHTMPWHRRIGSDFLF